MGLFNKIFGVKGNKTSKIEKKLYLNWIHFTSMKQLEEIKENSKTEPIFIFKHSTRCEISRMVLKQFEALFSEEYKNLKIYYLDLLNHRDISNEIGATFQVIHQSPQLLVIKNGISIQNASHYDITTINLATFI